MTVAEFLDREDGKFISDFVEFERLKRQVAGMSVSGIVIRSLEACAPIDGIPLARSILAMPRGAVQRLNEVAGSCVTS